MHARTCQVGRAKQGRYPVSRELDIPKIHFLIELFLNISIVILLVKSFVVPKRFSSVAILIYF